MVRLTSYASTPDGPPNGGGTCLAELGTHWSLVVMSTIDSAGRVIPLRMVAADAVVWIMGSVRLAVAAL